MIGYLCSRGADILAPFGASRRSVLHVVKNDWVALQLCKHGALVNARDDSSYTPLHHARCRDIARTLLKFGADINACFNNMFPLLSLRDPATVELLLAWPSSSSEEAGEGSSINIERAVLVQRIDSQTPSHISFLWRNYKSANSPLIQLRLLRYGVEELGFAECPPLQYPLHYALSEEVVEYLFSHLNGRERVFQLNAVSLQSPLHYAQTPQLVNILCDGGADPNALDKYNNSPLHCARNADTFIALCRRGANVYATNSSGETPMDNFVSKSLRSSTRSKATLMRHFFWEHMPMETLVKVSNWTLLHNKSLHFRCVTRELVSLRMMRFVCGFRFLSLDYMPRDITSLVKYQEEVGLLPGANATTCAVFSNEALCNLLRQF